MKRYELTVCYENGKKENIEFASLKLAQRKADKLIDKAEVVSLDIYDFKKDTYVDLDEEVNYYDDNDVKYDRRAVEKAYGLEDGELDGYSIGQAEDLVGEEEGALDRFIKFKN